MDESDGKPIWSAGSRRFWLLWAQGAGTDVSGLCGRADWPGDRKSVQPMAARDGDGGYDQLHHFIASGVWDAAPLENWPCSEADGWLGRNDACADRRRHGAAEEGRSLGRRRAAIRFGARQERQLPDAGVADAGFRRSAGHGGVAAVLARELDERSRAALPRRRAGGSRGSSNQAGDRARRDRSGPSPPGRASAACWRMPDMASARRSVRV